MTRGQLVWLHVSMAITAITGIVFAVMKYFMSPVDEFAVINHPLQPYMLSIHVVVAPVLLFILGWTFSNHMLPKYRFVETRHRKSGLGSMLLIAPMTLSAYFLQVTTNESLHKAMAIAHWVTSGLFTAGFLAHVVLSLRRRTAK